MSETVQECARPGAQQPTGAIRLENLATAHSTFLRPRTDALRRALPSSSKKISPHPLLRDYLEALKHVYSVPSIFRRLWGTFTSNNFSYPMSLGFRQGLSRLDRTSS